jgi:hypothetical protein
MDIRRLLFGSDRYRTVRWIGVGMYAVFFLIGFRYSTESGVMFWLLVVSPLLVATLVSAYRGGIVLCLIAGLVPVTIITTLVVSHAVFEGAWNFPLSVALFAFVAGGLWGILTASGGFVLGSLGRLFRTRWVASEISR